MTRWTEKQIKTRLERAGRDIADAAFGKPKRAAKSTPARTSAKNRALHDPRRAKVHEWAATATENPKFPKPKKRQASGIEFYEPDVPSCPSERLESRLKKPSKALKPVPTEHEEQVRVCQWWALYAAQHKIPECLLFAIPNGANKSLASAAKFKREGLRAGSPDLFLAIARQTFHGMAIEMKRTKGGVLSQKQSDVLLALSCQRYNTQICKGADEAIAAITRYLSA